MRWTFGTEPLAPWVLTASFVERGRGGGTARTLALPVRPASVPARFVWLETARSVFGKRKREPAANASGTPRGSERWQLVRAVQALAMIGVSAGGRTLAMTCMAPGPPPIGCPPDGPSMPRGGRRHRRRLVKDAWSSQAQPSWWKHASTLTMDGCAPASCCSDASRCAPAASAASSLEQRDHLGGDCDLGRTLMEDGLQDAAVHGAKGPLADAVVDQERVQVVTMQAP